jgi:hypothetical protein
MAKTIADLVTRATQRLYVKVGGETLSAEDMALGVDAWNGMVSGWFGDGLTPVADETLETPVPLTEGTVYTSGSTFPLLDRHFEGCAALVAVAISDDLQAQVGPALARDAMTGRQRIDAAFMPSMVASLDRALKRFPSSQYWPAD